jgi:hypothetical protein
MTQDTDKLALCCNVILERLVYLYNNSMISKQQFLENSRLKQKFLIDNIDNIESDDLKQRTIKILSELNFYLTFEKKSS